MSAPELFAVLVLALVLVAAIGSKVHSRGALATFSDSLAAWGLHDLRVRKAVTALVVLAEITALVVLMSVSTRWRFLPAGVFIVGLTVAYLVAVRRSATPVPCHCFAAAGSDRAGLHLAINIALILVSTMGWVYGDGHVSPTPALVLAAGLALVTAGVVLTAGIVVSTLTTREDGPYS